MSAMFSGLGILFVVLIVFSLISMKMPLGKEAISGMADAAIASFLIEAVHKYILGDALGLGFFAELGSVSGSLGGVGGAISNGVVFQRMGYGGRSNRIAVVLEPLTQAVIITAHPLPVYSGSFLGGALSGVVAAALGIVNNAPGTASTIPGLLAPFAFNDPVRVAAALGLSLVCGWAGGIAVSAVSHAAEKKNVSWPSFAPAAEAVEDI